MTSFAYLLRFQNKFGMTKYPINPAIALYPANPGLILLSYFNPVILNNGQKKIK